MKHNYISCDCCGKVINPDGGITFYKIKHDLRFGPWCSSSGDRVDICQCCLEAMMSLYLKMKGEKKCDYGIEK